MHTQEAIIPHLCIKGATEAIEFYKKAFGFVEKMRMPMPDGRIMHCSMIYGQVRLFLAEEFPNNSGCKSPATLGSTTITLHLNSPDVDAAFTRAVDAGCKVIMPVADMFWGDRYCIVADPFGHHWSIATHKVEMTAEQMTQRGAEMAAKWKPNP